MRDRISGPKRDLLISLHNLLIGGRLSALRAREQTAIVLWPALHRIASITPLDA
jgi:hypothetical protein